MVSADYFFGSVCQRWSRLRGSHSPARGTRAGWSLDTKRHELQRQGTILQSTRINSAPAHQFAFSGMHSTGTVTLARRRAWSGCQRATDARPPLVPGAGLEPTFAVSETAVLAVGRSRSSRRGGNRTLADGLRIRYSTFELHVHSGGGPSRTGVPRLKGPVSTC